MRAGSSRWRCFGHLVRMDFEGDQWTFFKPPPEDLERLFAVDIHEMQPYRPLPEAIAEQLAPRPHDHRRARQLPPARHRLHQLPHRPRQDLGRGRRHRSGGRAAALLPQRRAVGADRRRLPRRSAPGAARSPTVLPPYTELVRFDAGEPLSGEALRAPPARSSPATSSAAPRTTRSSASAPSSNASCRRCWRATSRSFTPTRSPPCGWPAPAFELAARPRALAARRSR